MPKILAQANCCFKKAIEFLKKYQNMALPDAVKLADFSVQEQACRPKHMVLYHLWKKAEGSNDNVYVTPPPELVDLSKEGIVSSVTKDSSSVKEQVEVVSKLTKVPHICLPIKFAQLH